MLHYVLVLVINDDVHSVSTVDEMKVKCTSEGNLYTSQAWCLDKWCLL